MSRALSAASRGAGPFLRRFSAFDRTLHALVIVSFLGLVATGVPLRFSYAPWARSLIRLLGGIETAGVLHRLCAVITFAYFIAHLGKLIYLFVTRPNKRALFWGPDSMVPQPKDIRDVIGMFKWFLGRGPRPQFERFSYMEKFDYWAVFWGVAIIGSSGLVLWFPEFCARFLPGWMFNVATIVHGDEALLALGFIFTIHFFNVHLRPEKFPIDLVIFTGQATRAYMQEEHPLEYERLQRDARLAALETAAPSPIAYVWSAALGFVALAVGIAMIALVVWAVVFH